MGNGQYIDIVEDKIVLNADVQAVYDHVIRRPNKLPSSWLFETRPFLIVRGFSLGFLGGALFMLRTNHKDAPEMTSTDLEPGSKYGPFVITAANPPTRLGMRLKTFLLDMDFDFLFNQLDKTRSNLILKVTARSKSRSDRMGIKAWEPVHHYMAQKMLAIYKKEIEAVKHDIGSDELSSERA